MTVFLLNAFLVSLRLLPVLVVAPVAVFARLPMMIRIILALSLALVLPALIGLARLAYGGTAD